jgi:pimeloyl-ACP methyl ester carboxylesterase
MNPLRRLMMAVALVVAPLFTSPAHAMMEGKFLYFPSHAANQSRFSEWKIAGKLIGYDRTVDKPRSIWLVLHGNAGQASHREYIVDLLPADASAYVMEYPGYGLRPGKPSKNSINAAAREAYDNLRTLHPNLMIGVLGESIGSGPASFLCSLPKPPDRLVLMVPFDNLISVAKQHMKLLPVGLLMRDKWDNVQALASYRGRVEIFGALHDTVIPVVHARNLAKSIPQARYVELPCGHNDWASIEHVRITDD